MTSTAPCLRQDLAILEQVVRGEKSYVVKDFTAQKYFRFGALEVNVMRHFDGRRQPVEIVEALANQGIRITTLAVETFARTLDRAGLLERTMGQRATLQMERLRAERRKRRRVRLFRGELLRMRWSFGNPDAILERLLSHLRWMFTPGFVVTSVALFALYLIILGVQWERFAAALWSSYAPQNVTLASLVLLWLTAGVVLLIHELGHGLTCKYYGGEVRELGFMFLYFQPAFYCNVSDAWSFPERRARHWVTAAGSWIDVVLASVAALVWVSVAPGTLIAELSVATMLMAGVTTMLANLNPLLPLDGYFALSDWLEIPNLRHRAFGHFTWWIRRHVFGLQLAEPAASTRERRVFLVYGALSAAYIAMLFAVIGALVLGWARQAFGLLGALVVIVAITALLRNALVEWGRTAAMAFRSRRAAWRAAGTSSWRKRLIRLVPGVLVLGGLLPWTLTSPGRFVAHPLESRAVTAAAEGIVDLVLVSEATRVEAGAPLFRLVDRPLERQLIVVGRTVDSLVIREASARAGLRGAEAEQLAAERISAIAQQRALEYRLSLLTIRAVTSGAVVTPRPEDLLGRRVRRGDTLLVLAAVESVEVRVALVGGGATRIRPGHVAHLVSYAGLASPRTGRVDNVSVIAGTGETPNAGVVEARIRLASEGPWRPGSTGEASLELARSNVFGALFWRIRQLVRVDLWL